MTASDRPQIVLAGDVGGTNTRLGIFAVSAGNCRALSERTFASRNYDGIEAILGEFLASREKISAACFGVAGPVVRGVAVATNLPWRIDVASLERALSVKKAALINDLVANAYGIRVLKRKDFEILNPGRRMRGNAALLSAGTGLGASILFWNGARHVPQPSEAGHAEFGPADRLEIELLQHLFGRYGHVSYERVLSGSGLVNIYEFLRDTRRYGDEPAWLEERMKQEDPAAAIAEAAQLKKHRLCEEALDLFASIYGAAAGNLALQVMAIAGVYIGGGIAPKIIGKLKDGTFMSAFRNKGRLSEVVKRVPVRVIMNDRAALLGAASYAGELLKDR